jgi:hypothetical protein
MPIQYDKSKKNYNISILAQKATTKNRLLKQLFSIFAIFRGKKQKSNKKSYAKSSF